MCLFVGGLRLPPNRHRIVAASTPGRQREVGTRRPRIDPPRRPSESSPDQQRLDPIYRARDTRECPKIDFEAAVASTSGRPPRSAPKRPILDPQSTPKRADTTPKRPETGPRSAPKRSKMCLRKHDRRNLAEFGLTLDERVPMPIELPKPGTRSTNIGPF